MDISLEDFRKLSAFASRDKGNDVVDLKFYLLGKEQNLSDGYFDSFKNTLEVNMFQKRISGENLDFLLYVKTTDDNRKKWLSVTREAMIVESAYRILRVNDSKRIAMMLENKVLFIKGFALESSLGYQLYKRSIDLDILIPKSERSFVEKKLELLGYKRQIGTAFGEFTMINKLGGSVDVHHDLTASSPFIFISHLAINEMFTSRKFCWINNVELPALNNEHAFIHLVLHFAINHQFKPFILLFELVSFQRRNSLKWDVVYDYVFRHNLQIVFHLTFKIIELMTGEAMTGVIELKRRQSSLRDIKDFIKEKKIIESLIAGSDNGMDSNTIPLFTAETLRARINYKLGNYAWGMRQLFR